MTSFGPQSQGACISWLLQVIVPTVLTLVLARLGSAMSSVANHANGSRLRLFDYSFLLCLAHNKPPDPIWAWPTSSQTLGASVSASRGGGHEVAHLIVSLCDA